MAKRGDIAFCGANSLGLITSDHMVEVVYPDGNNCMAWTGVHLTNRLSKIGCPWSSKNPQVVGRIEDFITEDEAHNYLKVQELEEALGA